MDVGLNMMRMFATIVNVPVNSLASVSPASEIGDEVNQVAVSESCDLVLVPYNGQKAVGGLTSRSKVEKIRDIVRTVRRAADHSRPDPATVTEKLIGRLTTECSANVTVRISHSVQIDRIVSSESAKKEYDFILLPRNLQGYPDSCQQSRSSLRSMSNLSRVGTDIALSSKNFVRNLINRKLNDDQGISRNQSETTLDGTAMRLSPTMGQCRGNNADDSDSLASTKSKKKRIEMETLGIVGQSLFNSNDLNAVLLVISQNV
uniref:Uncharacterized protein n=1 Tax=Romanomermis culicivorax TaxID=13658 RepID=A0A915J0N1_ROMCU